MGAGRLGILGFRRAQRLIIDDTNIFEPRPIDEGLNARGFWKTLKHPLMEDQKVGALAWNLRPPMPAPDNGGALLGEHTEQVLQEWLGMGHAEFEELKAEKLFV